MSLFPPVPSLQANLSTVGLAVIYLNWSLSQEAVCNAPVSVLWFLPISAPLVFISSSMLENIQFKKWYSCSIKNFFNVLHSHYLQGRPFRPHAQREDEEGNQHGLPSWGLKWVWQKTKRKNKTGKRIKLSSNYTLWSVLWRGDTVCLWEWLGN